MAASYPSSVRAYPVRKDVTEVIFAEHVNTLQEELSAVQTYIGINPHVSTTPNAAGTFISVASVFSSMAARLANIETGVVADVHTQYLHLKGGDTIVPSADAVRGLAIRARATQTAALLRAENSDGSDYFVEITTGGLAVKGALTVNGSAVVDLASAQTIAGIKTFTARPVMAAGITMGAAQTISFLPNAATSAAPTQSSGSVVLTTAYWNGTASVTTDTATITALRGSTTAGDLYVDFNRPLRSGAYTASSQVGFIITGAAGTTRDYAWQTAGVNRWLMRAANDGETGGAAGSTFQLHSRNDDGTSRAVVLEAKRDTGYVTIPTQLYEAGNRVYSAGNPPPASGHVHTTDVRLARMEVASYVRPREMPNLPTSRASVTIATSGVGPFVLLAAPAAGVKRVIKSITVTTRWSGNSAAPNPAIPMVRYTNPSGTAFPLVGFGSVPPNNTLVFEQPIILLGGDGNSNQLEVENLGNVATEPTFFCHYVDLTTANTEQAVYDAIQRTDWSPFSSSTNVVQSRSYARNVTAITFTSDNTADAVVTLSLGGTIMARLFVPRYGYAMVDVPFHVPANTQLVFAAVTTGVQCYAQTTFASAL